MNSVRNIKFNNVNEEASVKQESAVLYTFRDYFIMMSFTLLQLPET